jgi:hypothetical protein
MPQVQAVALGGDRAVLAVSLRTPSRVGLPLHLVEGSRVVRSFGSVGGAFRPDIPYFDERAIAAADPRKCLGGTAEAATSSSSGASTDASFASCAARWTGFRRSC